MEEPRATTRPSVATSVERRAIDHSHETPWSSSSSSSSSSLPVLVSIPRDQRPPTDREIDGGRRIFDRTFDLCRDPRSRRGTRRIEGGRRAACTRVARTRLRRRAVVAASASRSCRHRACVREHVFEPPPTTDCYEPPCVRPNDCPSRDHGRHMFVIRSVHEMYAVSS